MSELKRRNVLRMLALYVVAAWLIMQVAEVVIGLANLPDWIGPGILSLLALGLPIALVFSWFYELTPEGLLLEKDIEPGASVTALTGRRMDFVVIAVLSAGLLMFAYDKWGAGEPAERSIAVLPFKNMTPEDERAGFLANGIQEDLLTQLSKVGSLKVISRTSVERYRNTKQEMPQIGSELGVRMLLEGSVQGLGDDIRVNVQLIDAQTDEHIWAETYDRNLTARNVFAMQSAMVEAIAEQLHTNLTPQENKQLASMPTRNFDAYTAYLHGRNKANIQSIESLNEAIGFFKTAIELDENFALAYVGLADVYVTLASHFRGGLSNDEGIALAEPPVVMALALNPDLGEAHATLGALRLLQGDLEAAEAAYQKALSLRPNYARAFLLYGRLRMQQGQLAEAMELFQKVLRLDPYSATVNYEAGRLYDRMGQFDDALASYLRIIEVEPDYAFAYVYIAAIHYLVYGRADESLVWYQKAAQNDALSPSLQAAQTLAYLELGDMESARVWIDRGLELGPETFWAVWASLLYNVRAGNEEQIQRDARLLLEISPGEAGALMFLRDADIAAGRYEVARSRYARIWPALVAPGYPQVDDSNFDVAADLALVLQLQGEHEKAARLLDASLEVVATMPRLGIGGYYIKDVEILALQGRPEEALVALRSAVDEGWRFLTWYSFDLDPALQSIRERPEFQQLRDDVAKDLAIQAKRVKDLQASGELSISH